MKYIKYFVLVVVCMSMMGSVQAIGRPTAVKVLRDAHRALVAFVRTGSLSAQAESCQKNLAIKIAKLNKGKKEYKSKNGAVDYAPLIRATHACLAFAATNKEVFLEVLLKQGLPSSLGKNELLSHEALENIASELGDRGAASTFILPADVSGNKIKIVTAFIAVILLIDIALYGKQARVFRLLRSSWNMGLKVLRATLSAVGLYKQPAESSELTAEEEAALEAGLDDEVTENTNLEEA